jgi:tRNA nucleotidyltransferase (CCA-adding enzyme)
MDLIVTGKKILRKINSLGYEAYIVGGTVRDFLLSKEINDCDLTTNMPIELLKDHFQIIDNGSDYLSVSILYEGLSFEITHFRKDTKYLDHRHPEVELTDSYYIDSKRRDFTINALAMNESGEILDFYDGKKDLSNKIIKTIGDPFLRFTEDSLRILRGLYFSSKLGFEIESNTLYAMVDKKELLSGLSEERLYQYFIKILYAEYDMGIRYINELNLFQYIPKFKRWLNIVDKGMKEEDLIYYYYLNRHEFPITVSKEEYRNANLLELLLKQDDSYTLYKNKEAYFKFKDILKHFGCDIIGQDKKINNLIIKNDKELALSKEEIASYFIGKEKSLKIEEVLKAILNGDLKNDKEEIRKFILK